MWFSIVLLGCLAFFYFIFIKAKFSNIERKYKEFFKKALVDGERGMGFQDGSWDGFLISSERVSIEYNRSLENSYDYMLNSDSDAPIVSNTYKGHYLIINTKMSLDEALLGMIERLQYTNFELKMDASTDVSEVEGRAVIVIRLPMFTENLASRIVELIEDVSKD